ncbi:MAG: sialate O-acetylesterase, partial [Enterococcus gilvus]
QFGIRYYEAFDKQMDIQHSLNTEDETLSKIYGRETTKNEKIYLLSRDFALGEITYQTFIERFTELSNES